MKIILTACLVILGFCSCTKLHEESYDEHIKRPQIDTEIERPVWDTIPQIDNDIELKFDN